MPFAHLVSKLSGLTGLFKNSVAMNRAQALEKRTPWLAPGMITKDELLKLPATVSPSEGGVIGSNSPVRIKEGILLTTG